MTVHSTFAFALAVLIMSFNLSTPAQASTIESCVSYRQNEEGTMWSPAQIGAYCACISDKISAPGNHDLIKAAFADGQYHDDANTALKVERFCAGCNEAQFLAHQQLLDIYENCATAAAKQ